ncbi:Endoplasmic reticulum junction formation protein lunapark [Psilocybe cubensis]|uniref:Endoplasmic reticulum junction formation protein lunapark n=2 Tax=Psilocybe cubensis TaxID=181762 RepID=A0A8H8CKR8_PSICU|nr:Endoplasmic reticulum junction formation protein lunapark [Psilocybe cubensis]KAH9482111.1 Endoplasmic reticulum junction formation protein lunapark [Psilocybe cubensis]
MSFIRRIFSKKSEEDYETILSNLANEVQERQLKLSEIRLRERRSTLVVTLYTLAAWGAYVSLWYLNILPSITDGTYIRNASMERLVKILPVTIGPIIILFIRRVVQIWYKRKGDAEEKYLKELMKKRRDKVEEIKKKTNYYSTRDLIQKYDDATPSATPLRARFPQGQVPPTTPMRPQGPVNGNSVPQTPAPSSGLQAHLSPSTPAAYPIAPPRKQWYDKLADALLGEDDPSTASPSSRYALICEKCFNHNGLVKESMWEDAQYVCPKCGHFNASARSKKDPHRTPSPPSTTTMLPSSDQSGSGLNLTSNLPKSASKDNEGDSPTVDGTESTAMEVDQQDDSS